MNRKAFRLLLKRYLDNSCTDDERRIVDQWYELLDNENISLSSVEISEVEDRIWNKIQVATIDNDAAIPLKKKRNIWWRYAAVASVIGVVALVGALLIQSKGSDSKTSSLVNARVNHGFLEEINSTDTVKNVQLEDGSWVAIYPGSKLAFPRHFAADKREVYLEGNAFFTVTKKPGRPFFVYNNQIVTQVLGTSFTILGKTGQVEVTVTTGSVAVYENKEQIRLNEVQQKSNGVIITPNQKVIYYEQERHFVTSIVDQPIPVAKESDAEIAQNYFNYKETPLYKVLEDLENAYKLEIVLENEKMKNCLFTGDLAEQSLFNKLESVCLVFNSSYEIKGTKILLKGKKECN